MARAKGSKNGSSSTSWGMVSGSLPLGLASPNSRRASAAPPSMPLYQASRIAGTRCLQVSMVTALPAIRTTARRSLTPATASISSRSRGLRPRGYRSPPASVPGRLLLLLAARADTVVVDVFALLAVTEASDVDHRVGLVGEAAGVLEI